MSDDAPHVDDRDDPLDPRLSALLADASVWDDASPFEDQILAAILSEVSSEPTSLQTARAKRTSAFPRWMLVAAAIAVIGVAASLLGRGSSDEASFALAATDLAPGASADAEITATPAGLKIVLDVDGLPGAAPGQMYEAWVTDGTIRISAGTFHLRGGSGPIELWAGVADPSFHIITVTLEPVDGVAESSGQVVLRGEYTLEPDGG
jgi:Anti-sigma-K factor rskA